MREIIGHQESEPQEPRFIGDLLNGQQDGARAAGQDVQDEAGDSAMIGDVSYDGEMVTLLCILRVRPKNSKRENRAARRRLVSEIYSPP